jgi:hypothetical protein
MTRDDAADVLALLAKLNRTIDAQAAQIEALTVEVSRLTERQEN